MAQIKFASIGSVSEGTLRDEDLLDTFASELETLLKRQSSRFPRARYRRLIRAARSADGSCGADDENKASAIVSELIDALSEFAAPYAYFGTLDGDGACFGFFVSDPRQQGFDGLTVADTGDVPRDYRGEVLHVNDHGNMTLYVRNARGVMREIWGVV